MKSLDVIYSRSVSLGSFLIRAGAWWGPWSHCGIVDSDGNEVIESLASRGGVVITPLSEVIERSSATQIVSIECPNPDKAIEWARSMVGKPYDWAGLLAIPFRERKWQSENRWYCSEHVEMALKVGGRERFRDGLHGISPCQSYFVR